MSTQQQTQGDLVTLPVSPLLLQSPFAAQQALFVEVSLDDEALLQLEDQLWLRMVRTLRTTDWRPLRPTAAKYYQAVWQRNVAAASKRQVTDVEDEEWLEDEKQGSFRLLGLRPTGGNTEAPILHPTPVPPQETPSVREDVLEPGVVPFRIAGKAPKCFFGMLFAFLALNSLARAGGAAEVHQLLLMSPPLARACGFTIRRPGQYRHTDIPSLRKLEDFEQLMGEHGLWAEVRHRTVRDNLASGIVDPEGETLSHDTTHLLAASAMDVLTLPEAQSEAASSAPVEPQPSASVPALPSALSAEVPLEEGVQPAGTSSTGKESEQTGKAKKPKRKSQSRTIKTCRCSNQENCPHAWVESDQGAGTVVKGSQTGGKRMYWAHKAAVIAITPLGIPLDVVAMSDAASHDGTALLPHLRRLFELYPELKGTFKRLVADTAYDDAPTKKTILEEFQIQVTTNVNPRNRKTLTNDLGKGMKSLSPIGTLTCQADHEMNYLGARVETEHFLYGPPALPDGQVACNACPLKQLCCSRDNEKGRHASVPFTQLPLINAEDPPMARRFKAVMHLRPVIERVIKRIKLDFGDDRLTRRGNNAFQAHLDRSLTAFHLLLRLNA